MPLEEAYMGPRACTQHVHTVSSARTDQPKHSCQIPGDAAQTPANKRGERAAAGHVKGGKATGIYL